MSELYRMTTKPLKLRSGNRADDFLLRRYTGDTRCLHEFATLVSDQQLTCAARVQSAGLREL